MERGQGLARHGIGHAQDGAPSPPPPCAMVPTRVRSLPTVGRASAAPATSAISSGSRPGMLCRPLDASTGSVRKTRLNHRAPPPAPSSRVEDENAPCPDRNCAVRARMLRPPEACVGIALMPRHASCGFGGTVGAIGRLGHGERIHVRAQRESGPARCRRSACRRRRSCRGPDPRQSRPRSAWPRRCRRCGCSSKPQFGVRVQVVAQGDQPLALVCGRSRNRAAWRGDPPWSMPCLFAATQLR